MRGRVCGGGAVEGSGVNEFSENSCFLCSQEGFKCFQAGEKNERSGHATPPRHVATSM